MTTLPPQACRACSTLLQPTDRFCRQCGAPAALVAAPRRPAWYYNLWVLLGLLFFVLGPFGLPLVWKHPTLPRAAKAALTALVLLYTVWLCQVTWQAAELAMKHLGDLDSLYTF